MAHTVAQEELQVDCSYNVDCAAKFSYQNKLFCRKTQKLYIKYTALPFSLNCLFQNGREWGKTVLGPSSFHYRAITWFGNYVKWALNAGSQLRDQLNVLWMIRKTWYLRFFVCLGGYHHDLVKTHSYSLFLKTMYYWDTVRSGSIC